MRATNSSSDIGIFAFCAADGDAGKYAAGFRTAANGKSFTPRPIISRRDPLESGSAAWIDCPTTDRALWGGLDVDEDVGHPVQTLADV